MEIKELRIGNSILNHKGEVETVRAIGINDYIWFDKERNLLDKLCKPIPLTEEWLLKCGFKKFESTGVVGFDYSDHNEKTFVYDKGRFGIVKWGINSPFFYSNHNLRIELKTVHQLQNLYFALTNEELTWKSKEN
jgi:hypothetical protein